MIAYAFTTRSWHAVYPKNNHVKKRVLKEKSALGIKASDEAEPEINGIISNQGFTLKTLELSSLGYEHMEHRAAFCYYTRTTLC